MTDIPEIKFSVFAGKGNGALLRSDFSESELAEIAATPERAAAFENLKLATTENQNAESAFDTATKTLSAVTRAFNDAKASLLASVPKRTFLQEWRESVKGR